MKFDALFDSFKGMYISAQEFLPKIIVGLILLFIGWIIAKFCSRMFKKLLTKINVDKMSEKLELDKVLFKMNPDLKLSGILAKILYYLILIVFLIATADVLQMVELKKSISSILAEAPKFFIALIILVFGYYVGKIIQKAVFTATNSMGISGAKIISNIVFYVIMVFVFITALEQTGMNTDLISNNVTMIIAAILLAFSLAYAYASKGLITNMLSSYYGKGKFSVGQEIKVLDTQGKIIKIDSISFTLESEGKKIVLPSKTLIENKVEILNENTLITE